MHSGINTGLVVTGEVNLEKGTHGLMGDAINTNLFTRQELEAFADAKEKIGNWLHQRGIAYIYVIAPNKHTIYFDKLPEYVEKQNPRSATDQLVAFLAEHTDIHVVDLRGALLAERQLHQVYYKHDTHWNHFGANAAQFEIMQHIERIFPGRVSPQLLEEERFNMFTSTGGDLASFAKMTPSAEINPQPVFIEGCRPVKDPPDATERDPHTMICDNQQLNAVVFRDSFFSALQPYIARQFKRSTYIWENLDFPLLKKYVEQESPDIVIEEVIERKLPYVPSNE